MSIIPVPAVNAIIFNEDRTKVLLTRRSKQVREPGKWCLPGGHLEGGEPWVDALRREVEEEVGLKVTGERLVGIYSDPELTVTEKPIHDDTRVQFVAAVFEVTAFSGEVKPNDEVDKWGWYDVESLPKPMLKSHPVRVKDGFAFKGLAFVR